MTKCKVNVYGEISQDKLKKACELYLQNKEVQKVIYEIQNNVQ